MKNTMTTSENTKKQPRGLRNNNPLNIRRTQTVWEHQLTGAAATDAEFCQFDHVKYGWRAALIMLTRTYYKKYHLYTIEQIIRRWAPPSENYTTKYIDRVELLMAWPREMPLGLPGDAPERWMMLAYAMATVENGTTDIDPLPLLKAWTLVRVHNNE